MTYEERDFLKSILEYLNTPLVSIRTETVVECLKILIKDAIERSRE